MKINSINLNFRAYKEFTPEVAREIRNLARNNTHNKEIENTEYIFTDKENDIISVYSGSTLRALYLWGMQTHRKEEEIEY